jgi:anti-anti-sigma factor
MSVTANVDRDDGVVDIAVSGRFDFSLQKDFRASYRDCAPGLKYRVDLAAVEYLDSAALGMLLLLRQHAGGQADSVVLCQPSEPVHKILQVANFDRIFSIE